MFQTKASGKDWQVVSGREGEVNMADITDLSPAERKQFTQLAKKADSDRTEYGVRKTPKQEKEDHFSVTAFIASHNMDEKTFDARQLGAVDHGKVLWSFGTGNVFSDRELRDISKYMVTTNKGVVPLFADSDPLSKKEQQIMDKATPYTCVVANDGKAVAYSVNYNEKKKIDRINMEISKIEVDQEKGGPKYSLTVPEKHEIDVKNAEILSVLKGKAAFACTVSPDRQLQFREMTAMTRPLDQSGVKNLAMNGITLPEQLQSLAKVQAAEIFSKPQQAKITN